MAERPARASLAESEDRVRALAAILLQDAGRFDRALRGVTAADSWLEMPISGGSMGATIPDGAVARVSLENRPPAVGDIVIFRQGQQLVAHRVVYRGSHGRAAGHLITRGDARIAPDPPVPTGRVLGRITALAGSSGLLAPEPIPRRSWPARLGRGALLLATATTLHASPWLAVLLTRLATFAERLGFPATPWRWVKTALGRAPSSR